MDEARGTILIVDDEKSIRSIISQKLKTEGYTCVLAANGEEALDKASSQDFDLVLLDIKMPGMSGIDVLPQLTFDHPDIGVVMSTALNDTQTAVEAMNLGAYDYVTKPFDLDALSLKVERALERRRLVLENRDYGLRQAEEDYSALVENLADAIFKFHQGAIAWCNDRVEDILGYTKDELIGKDVGFILPDDVRVSEIMREIEAAIEERGRLRGTIRMTKKDGSVVYIEYSASQIPGKEPVEIVAVLRDITGFKKMQEEQERLMSAHKEQTHILSRAYSEVEEALSEAKVLRGLLPICGRCRKIRDDSDYWNQVEAYVTAHADAELSYGVCPDCEAKHSPSLHQED